MSGRILLKAVVRTAWTFACSAFSYTTNTPWEVTLRGCPQCAHLQATRPACDYYFMTIQHLFQDLVAPNATVTETIFQATGAEACVFRIAI